MAERTSGFGHAISRNAEQQMRQWALGMEIQERVEHEKAVAELPEQVHPYLAISRVAGAGGGEVARRVGRALGWEVFDREMLNHMADRYQVPRDMLEFVDETAANWLLEVLGKWLNRRVVTQSEYVVRLGRIVLMAARHANTVFVGRGAQFLLPREKGLAVEIIAPLNQRLQRTMQHRGFSREQAKKYVEEADKGRRDFIQSYFHHDVADPHLYDLVINLQFLDLDGAVDLIVGQCRRRFSESWSVSSKPS